MASTTFADASTVTSYTDLVDNTYQAYVYLQFSLTTVFTPPSSCLATTYTLSPEGSDVFPEEASVSRGYHSPCYPPGFQVLGHYADFPATSNLTEDGTTTGLEVSTTSTVLSTTRTDYSAPNYYSPGICPSG